MKAIDSDEAALAEATRRLHSLRTERGELAAQLQELGASDPREDAEALLAGQSLRGTSSKSRQEAAAAERRLAAVEAAIPIQEDRVTVARQVLDDAIKAKVVKEARELGQRFAEELVTMSETATELHGLVKELDDRGIPRSHILPGLNLAPLRADTPSSRANQLLDELIRDGYARDVKRPILDAERERRRRAHLDEQARLRNAGALVAAGPDGVKDYEPGGKIRRPAVAPRRFTVPRP